MIFVHGGAGSGGQFESQGLRFSSNGYPQRYIHVFEYDSTTALANLDSLHTRLDQLIAQVKQQTGKSKVDILGHSLGTTVMHPYLASPARAANIAHYVNIDGRTAQLAAGRRADAGSLGRPRHPGPRDRRRDQRDDPQPDPRPGRRHRSSRSCRSSSSSRAAPRAGTSLPQRHITLSGRAQLFPENTGVGDRTLQIWEVKGSTGQRKRKVATLDIAARRRRGARCAGSSRAGTTSSRCCCRARRRITSTPSRSRAAITWCACSRRSRTAGVNLLIERSPRHSAVTIVRYKELWGDQGAESDVLSINGTDVVNAGHRADRQARDRDVRLRHRVGWREQRERAAPGASSRCRS